MMTMYMPPCVMFANCSPIIFMPSFAQISSLAQELALVGFTPMQPTLFGAPAATNGFRNSSFAKNKNLPLHRWVPWVAGFSAEFVEDAIKNYLPDTNSER